MFAIKVTGWYTGAEFILGSFATEAAAERMIERLVLHVHSGNKHEVVPV